VTVAETIRRKLTQRLAPIRLDIVDESHHHAGHAGARPEGETHFAVSIVAAAFAGLNRVARQRLVYDILADELATRVHALSLTTLAPDDPQPGGRA
jgi:BolA family transcriptional regulator, general stress-responsive regulator